MKNIIKLTLIAVVCATFTLSCKNGGTQASNDGGDTIKLKYAELLTMVRHEGYIEVKLADPWNEGKTLHTYILVPNDERTPDNLPKGTIVRTPIQRAVVATSVHCSLLMNMGKGNSICGVCDIGYINLPWIQQQYKSGKIADCGNGMTPTLEKIIDINADAILISPFQNSGGYGRLTEWGRPIIETADYMETSALGRAEWMKFYGLLFGSEEKAEQMFNGVEKRYNDLKATAKAAGKGKSVIMDKLTGSVWYVPGGHSTIGRIIADANADYPFASDENSGSLPLPFETVFDKGNTADVWLFRYSSPTPATYSSFKAENKGYAEFKAYKNKAVYGCNTMTSTFYEDTPFNPDVLLKDFIIITHPQLTQLGQPRYFKPLR